MPRQIIDTESSRPRYIRRLVITWVLVAIVVAILVIAAFAAYGRFSHPASHALGVAPGKWIAVRVSQDRHLKENPCCVA